MSARILFLDDMHRRHETFFETVKDVGITIDRAFSADEAIELLKKHSYDQVFLDHDLSVDDIMCEVGAPTKVPTGMAVVNFMMQTTEMWGGMPDEVIVHSCNTVAATEMCDRLREVPFLKVRQIPFPHLITLIRTGVEAP